MILSSYISSIKQTLQNWNIWIICYIVHLVFLVLLARPLYKSLASKLEYSLEGNNALDIFDYTFVSEVLRSNGDVLLYFFSALGIILFIYAWVKIYLEGAVISAFISDSGLFINETFWNDGIRHFWRLLRLAIYFLIIRLFILFVFVKLYFLGETNIFNIVSDQIYIKRIVILLPLFFLINLCITAYHQLTKVHLIANDHKSFFKGFWKASRFTSYNIVSLLTLILFYVLLFVLFYGIYFALQNTVNYTGKQSFILFLLLGQIFIIARLGISLVFSSGICQYYLNKRLS